MRPDDDLPLEASLVDLDVADETAWNAVLSDLGKVEVGALSKVVGVRRWIETYGPKE